MWLSLDGVAPHWLLHPVSLAYLGFAFALWPLWIPWSALRWSRHRILPWQEKLMRLLACGGGALAAVLWMPLLFGAAQLNPQLRLGSIDYQVQLPGGDRLWHEPVLLVYAVIICGPLLLSSCSRLRWFAAALAIAFAVAEAAFRHAFSSVWCYLSALLSLMVLWALQESPRHHPSAELPNN